MLKNSLLWEISDPDCNNISYVFGTMHVKDKVAFERVDSAINYMYRCDSYFGEMDLKASQDEVKYSDYLLPDGRSLKYYLKDRHYIKMCKIVKKAYGVNLNELQFFKPFIILTKISESILEEDNSKPLDYFLWQKAESLNMEMHGLETVSEQVETMYKLDLNEQVRMLRKSLKNINQIKTSTLQLAQYYQEQNITQLFKSTKKSLGKFRKILLYDRNKIMAERIAENASQKSFYTIGAAHLAGKKGVLKLVKDHGLKVKAIIL
jgi:uncharacterized protein YbaP (TraB family)